MRIFDPHIHMYSRTTDDYEHMATAGIEAVVEPAFWLGHPRTHLGTFLDYFDYLLGFETERAARHGIRHLVALSLNPREANDRKVSAEVLERLPDYLDRPGVVGVGEVGFDDITAAEEEALRAQVEVARRKDLNVLVHTPHRDKRRGTERSIAVLREMGADPDRVLIDHNTEETIDLVRAYGAWAGHTVYPVTKLTPERAVNIMQGHGTDRLMVNSSADWGPSDPLAVCQVAREMRRRGYAREEVQKVVWDNPVAFWRQGGRAKL
ncbi:MAG: TatD family hydrolase [Planctomycetes bacterium]|nr:TatD family hydrolase [Planctomycetota bacterium]